MLQALIMDKHQKSQTDIVYDGGIFVELAIVFMLVGLGFSLAAPIGPVNMEMLRQSLSRSKGWIFGITTGLGAMSADLFIALAATYLGVEILADLIGILWVKLLLFLSNAFLLFYIAWGAWNAEMTEGIAKPRPENEETLDPIQAEASAPTQYAKGFVLVVTSPWSYLWWVSFGGFLLGLGLDMEEFGSRMSVVLVFLIGIFTWVSLFCGSLGFSRRFASESVLRFITRTSAVVIVGFALLILYDACETVFAS